MRVVLGGTFDLLHDGHEALLAAAFRGKPARVLIGLTSDRMAREARPKVNAYAVRERNLRRFLATRRWRNVSIEKIDDAYGPADDIGELDVLVVSAERASVAAALNEARRSKGLRTLEVRVVPMVLAQDGLPIASRRIRAGLIDRHGKRLKAVVARVGTDNPIKARAVRRIFKRLRISARVQAVRVPRDAPDQPFGRESLQGAIGRAKAALGTGDFGVGIEAGLQWDAVAEDYFDVQYAAIVDRSGRTTVGHGPGFVYPPEIVRRVRAGGTVGEAIAAISGVPDIGRKEGAIGYLTNRVLDRDRLTEASVLMAMVPRIRRDLYTAREGP